MRNSKRDTDVKNRLLDSVGEGKGGMIWENSIETCKRVLQTCSSVEHIRLVINSLLQGRNQFSSVQSLSHVWLFATPWNAPRQASLSITNSKSSLRLMSIESVMPSSHLILCRPLFLLPQSLPASESFPMSQLFASGGQSTGASALATFLPKKSQGWSPSEWSVWISLQCKGLSKVFLPFHNS